MKLVVEMVRKGINFRSISKEESHTKGWIGKDRKEVSVIFNSVSESQKQFQYDLKQGSRKGELTPEEIRTSVVNVGYSGGWGSKRKGREAWLAREGLATEAAMESAGEGRGAKKVGQQSLARFLQARSGPFRAQRSRLIFT